MTGAAVPLTNLERLKKELKKDSLAARLVEAQMSAKPGAEQAALKRVIADRLDELRKKYAGPANHQA
jgi:hypothetical protein